MADIDSLSGTDSVSDCLDSVYNDLVELNNEVSAISVGNIAWTYADKTASYSIVAATDTYGTKVFTNDGATGTITLSLPAGIVGMRVSFNVVDAYTLKVLANGSATIRFLGSQTAAGGYVQSAVAGTFWTLEHNGDEWIVTVLRGVLVHASGIFKSDTLPQNYLTGLTLSNGTDASHDINIAAGKARDSTDSSDLVLATTWTKQIDTSFAAGTAAGGLFTGSVAASTWYPVFLIEKDSDASIDAGFDTNVSAANIPTGYTRFRRLGSVKTDASANINAFYQVEEYFGWDDPPMDVSAGDLGTTGTLYSLSVPTGVKVEVHINTDFKGTATTLIYGVISSPEENDEAPSESTGPLYNIGNYHSTAYFYPSVLRVITNTSGQIRARSTAVSSLGIATIGWREMGRK